MGVGSSNRKNQWQARILVHGKACRLACLRLPVLTRPMQVAAAHQIRQALLD